MGFLVNNENKATLMARGLWGDFVRERERRILLTENEGRSRYSIVKELLGEIAPDLLPQSKRKGRPAGSKDSEPRGVKGEIARQISSGIAERQANNAALGSLAAAGAAGSEELVDPSVFEGKKCTWTTAFLWAFGNQPIRGVRPEDAPSAAAWQMYLVMKKSPAAMIDWAKSGIMAKMKREDESENQSAKFDGEAEYDILAAFGRSEGAE